jgi:hypothetical protein
MESPPGESIMSHPYRIALLAGIVLLLGAPTARSQWYHGNADQGWRDRGPDDLSGPYINTTNGGRCFVARAGAGYIFTNENGTPARFVFSGPGRLRMTSGNWDPNTTVFVERGRRGRLALRFQGPDPTQPPGFWEAQF